MTKSPASRCRSIASRSMLMLGVMILIIDVYVSVLFRDGMGSDSVRSTGLTALSRFLEGFWALALVASALLLASYATYRLNRKAQA